MNIYIIAGEASGDLHGGNLILALKKQNPSLNIRAWGGDNMEQAGAELVKHYKNLAFMGFVEVLRNFPGILKNFQFAQADILQYQPDRLILIDYPGFNLRIAKWAHQHNIPVVYYILPQIWAWHSGRIKYLRKYTRLRLAILPFEKSYYQAKKLNVHYVGHPLVAHVENYKQMHDSPPKTNREESQDSKGSIALLPGSRLQELKKHLPLLIPLVQRYPDLHFELAVAPGLPEELSESLKQSFPGNCTIKRNTYGILHRAKIAVVCSGTATLETALFQVPQIVFYRTNILNYLLAKLWLKVHYVSLVNLILQKPLLKEIVHPLNQKEKLIQSFEALLTNEHQENIRSGYLEIHEKLGHEDASVTCSKLIFNM
jgi:lipid-A-disaccharide synthase